MNKAKFRAISIVFFLFLGIGLIYQNATLTDNPVKPASSVPVNCYEGAYKLGSGIPSKFYPGKCDYSLSKYEGFPDKSWEDGVHSLWEEQIHWAFEPKEPGQCEKENAVNSKFYPGKCDRTYASDLERSSIPELSWNDGVHSIRQREWAGSIYVSGYITYDPLSPSDNNAPIDENKVKIESPMEGENLSYYFSVKTKISNRLEMCDSGAVIEISKDINFEYWWAYFTWMGWELVIQGSQLTPVNTSKIENLNNGTYFVRTRCRHIESGIIKEILSPIVSFKFENPETGGGAVPTDLGVRPGEILRFNSGREVELTPEGVVILKKKSGRKKVINKNDRFKWIGGDSLSELCGITTEGAVKCRRSIDIVNGIDAQWVYSGKMRTVNALKSIANEIDYIVSSLPFIDQLPKSNCQNIDSVWRICESFFPAECGYDSDSKRGLCWGYNQIAKVSGSPFNPATYKYEPQKAEIGVVKVKYDSESALFQENNTKAQNKKYSRFFDFNMKNFILPYAFADSPSSLEFKAGELLLGPNQVVQLQNHSLQMHESGDLILSRLPGGAAVWTLKSSKFCQKKPCWAHFSSSGELFIVDRIGRKFWTAGVSGGSKLILQNEEPQLRIVDQMNTMIWRLPNYGVIIPDLFSRYEFVPGSLDLEAEEFLETDKNRLVMQGDGNLVLYVKENGRADWSSKTASACGFGSAHCSLNFNDTGNLVITREDGCEVWESGTSAPGGLFILRDEAPKLRILGRDGHIHWEFPARGKLKSCLPNRLAWRTGEFMLSQGQSVEIDKHRLAMKGDGNLVLTQKNDNKVLWESRTVAACDDGKEKCSAYFQGDGNLVIRRTSGCPVWATQTQGKNAVFIFRDEAPYLRIMGQDGAVHWEFPNRGQLKSSCLPKKLEFKTGQLTLKQGESIEVDQHKLVMQGDGNLCVNKKSNNKNVWCSATNKACGDGKDNCAAIFRSDGNFVIAQDNGNDCAVWATDTLGSNSSFIFRDENPWLRIVGASGGKKWESSDEGKLKTCKRQWKAGGLTLTQGQSVELDEHKLVMQTDGNLVMRRKVNNVDVWNAATNVVCERPGPLNMEYFDS